MSKYFSILIIIVSLIIIPGCSEDRVSLSIKDGQTHTTSPTESISYESVNTPVPSESETTPSTESANYESVNTPAPSESETTSSTESASYESVNTPVPGEPETTPPMLQNGDETTTTPIRSEPSKNTEDNKMDNNCKLIVRGRDLTSEVYVHLNEEKRDVELPLISVMRELGATVEWKDKTTVTMEYCGEVYVLDTDEQAFGLPLPPGATLCVRNVVDNEIIVDSTSVSGLIHWMGAKVKIDYDERIVEIG